MLTLFPVGKKSKIVDFMENFFKFLCIELWFLRPIIVYVDNFQEGSTSDTIFFPSSFIHSIVIEKFKLLIRYAAIDEYIIERMHICDTYAIGIHIHSMRRMEVTSCEH